jgi:hypothetical protein
VKLLRFFFVLGAAFPLAASITVSLSADQPQPQPVGATISWAASASPQEQHAIWYRFAVKDSSGNRYIAKDYSPDATFIWTPGEQEDMYEIEATAMDTVSGETAQSRETFTIVPAVADEMAVVHSTNHPLVALYSAPPCPLGSSMDVRFQRTGTATSAVTPAKSCTGKSMNFYVGGMYPNSTYTMYHEVTDGSTITTSPTQSFTTGPSNCSASPITINLTSWRPGAFGQSVMLWAPIQNGAEPFATDLQGNLLWCYPYVTGYMPRPIAGGQFFVLFTDGTNLAKNSLGIIDMAGNIIQQTTVPRMNQELAAAGYPPINQFHHDARKLDNGDILVLAASERILTDEQGPGPVDVLGDMILVLDSNLQLKWVWDSFEHLDVTRAAVLGEQCLPGGLAGCPPILQSTVANDWTHGNSVDLTVDGDIIYSARHQDFVYRIDYKNGTGTGNVIWRLGKGGDFSTDSSDVFPWNSHQHDVGYDGTGRMTIFDNGNTRYMLYGSAQQSRGQVLKIDEAKRSVHYVMNQPLGVFSSALGTAQRLSNGNYDFESGYVQNDGAVLTQVAEYTPGGKKTFQAETTQFMYRMFRMNTLYQMDVPGAQTKTAKEVLSQGFTKPASQATTTAIAAPAATATNSAAEMASLLTVVPSAQESTAVQKPFTLTTGVETMALARGTAATAKIASSDAVTLTAVASPENAPLTVSLSSDSEVTVTAAADAAPGDYRVIVAGTQQSLTKTVTIDVKILR